MATINARLSLRSSNLFKNTISQRHDRSFRVEAHVESGTRLIKTTDANSPYTLVDGTDYYDSSETGATANQVMVFLRNISTTGNKTIAVQFYDGTNRQDSILLNAGEFTIFPWKCNAASEDIEVFSNDTNGVRVEYLVSPML